MSDAPITSGKCVIVHDDRFARVIAAWRKVGQHQRDWYLVTHDRHGWEIVPDYTVQPAEEDLTEDTGFTVEVNELPEDLIHRTVVDSAEPNREFGSGFAVVTTTDRDGTVRHTSLGKAGSGYPWWVVPLKDSFRLVDWNDVDWDTYPDSLSDSGEAFRAEWTRAACASPKFPQFS